MDPKFAEPWAHEARGVELQHQVATGVDTGGLADFELLAWRYRDAIKRGDRAAANASRAAFWTHDETSGNPHGRSFGATLLVLYEEEAGDFASAAEDILRWLQLSHADGNYAERDNCKQVVSVAVEFLQTPGGSTEPRARAILDQARTLGIQAEDYLSHPTLVGLQRLQGL